jgi:hypothetical protein
MRNLLLILILIPIVTYSQNIKRIEKSSYHYGTNVLNEEIYYFSSEEKNSTDRWFVQYDEYGNTKKEIKWIYDSYKDLLADKIEYQVYWDDYVKIAKEIQIRYYNNEYDGSLHYIEYFKRPFGWYQRANFRGSKIKKWDYSEPAYNGFVSNYEMGHKYDPTQKKFFPINYKKAQTLFINNTPIDYQYYYQTGEKISKEKKARLAIVTMPNVDYTHYSNIADFPYPNEYDIELMVKIFFEDIFAVNKYYGSPSNLITKLEENKNIVFNNIVGLFESLDGDTLAQSFAIGDDNKVLLKIDSKKWVKATTMKRWYILYHELGHDVLNLRHGQGGKMMFPFPLNKEITMRSFVEDRDYMFKSFLKIND